MLDILSFNVDLLCYCKNFTCYIPIRGLTWSNIQIYRNQIFRLYEDPSDSLSEIRDQDKLVAYRIQNYNKAGPLVVFSHKRLVEK